MDAFFVSSRRATTENSPQFQLRVAWERTSQVPQERKNLSPLRGLGVFTVNSQLKPWIIVGRASGA
jgi:hypothetical protein